MPRAVRLRLSFRSWDGVGVANDPRIVAHVSCGAPLTAAEMQPVALATKMALAKVLAARKRKR